MKQRTVQVILALLVGLAGLYFFARDMNWREVGEAITQAHGGWLVLAVALGILSMFIRAVRWRSFLGAPKVPVGQLFLIMNIGFMGNGVLPARMGELIRPLLVGRFTPHRFSSALATIVVERVFDLLGILLCLSVVFLFLPFPVGPAGADTPVIQAAGTAGHGPITEDPRRWMQDLAYLGIGLFVGLFSALGVMVYAPAWSLRAADWFCRPLPRSVAEKVRKAVESFERGASTFRRPRSFAWCLFLTLALWLEISFSELVVLWAFGVNQVNLLGAMFIMASLCFAVMFPQAPGYIGVYHYALKLVLVNTFFVDPDQAGAIALVMWLSQIPPVILLGFISLLWMGVSLGEIRRGEPVESSGAAPAP